MIILKFGFEQKDIADFFRKKWKVRSIFDYESESNHLQNSDLKKAVYLRKCNY